MVFLLYPPSTWTGTLAASDVGSSSLLIAATFRPAQHFFHGLRGNRFPNSGCRPLAAGACPPVCGLSLWLAAVVRVQPSPVQSFQLIPQLLHLATRASRCTSFNSAFALECRLCIYVGARIECCIVLI
ncbi:hypothetical protein B0T26DRAFT_721016 [Lasiosphaeria miniovina]|uniref:Uncharacterized protein n=1 Tax=Lasiosphaeria miniovina TaxID=1954250 RepID=A0AA40A4P2_9PEZI|nr:uncharacterized protein B0T26DRAFT_721016 [Lasiosphaeria miniovina]KAK0709271.1 hypothetical protein B0T26DRAFT_721016 [Lasiosphaeria miniovina]